MSADFQHVRDVVAGICAQIDFGIEEIVAKEVATLTLTSIPHLHLHLSLRVDLDLALACFVL